MDLSREDFDNLRTIIKERSGISLGDSRMGFLKSRLAPRLKATDMETVKDYYYYLRYDPSGESELDEIIDAVTVNETHFFRESEQLEDFSREAVPKILSEVRRLGPLTVWSAGCSTGEEPYTLAMLLLEHPAGLAPSRIDILASDISHSVLRAAREGIYDAYSMRHLPAALRDKYFDEAGQGRFAVKEKLKQVVRFTRTNLMDAMATRRIKNIDCVFCRNVIIYFDDRDKSRCMENLYQSLNRGGFLFPGHSESLARFTNLFEIVRLDHTVGYRRPL